MVLVKFSNTVKEPPVKRLQCNDQLTLNDKEAGPSSSCLEHDKH